MDQSIARKGGSYALPILLLLVASWALFQGAPSLATRPAPTPELPSKEVQPDPTTAPVPAPPALPVMTAEDEKAKKWVREHPATVQIQDIGVLIHRRIGPGQEARKLVIGILLQDVGDACDAGNCDAVKAALEKVLPLLTPGELCKILDIVSIHCCTEEVPGWAEQWRIECE
jgi:hypothetical protein